MTEIPMKRPGQVVRDAEIVRLTAERDRLRTAVEDAVETLESMNLHVDNPLYDRLCAALEQQSAAALPEGVTEEDLRTATDLPPLGDSRRATHGE